MTTNERPTPPYVTTYGELQEGDIYIPRIDGAWQSASKHVYNITEYGEDVRVAVLAHGIWPTERMIRVLEGIEDGESTSGGIFCANGEIAYNGVTEVSREIVRDFHGDTIERYEEVIPISAALLERVIREGEPCQYCDDCPTMGTHTVMAELRSAIEKWRKEGK